MPPPVDETATTPFGGVAPLAIASTVGLPEAEAPPAVSRPPVTPIWGLPLARVTAAETVDWIGDLIGTGKPHYLITANLNWMMLSHRFRDLDAVNRGAAGILADGMPAVCRSRLGPRSRRLPERVAGSELIYRLAERGAERRWRFFLLGAAPGIAARAAENLQARYPGLRIAGIESPPFRQPTAEEHAALLTRIREASPDILLVAFGQPKGERWIHQHYRELGVPVSIQLGASFDFVAGAARRAPRFWQRTGLEWAYRMAHDPRRLVPRYAANAAFLAGAVFRDLAQCRRRSAPTTGAARAGER